MKYLFMLMIAAIIFTSGLAQRIGSKVSLHDDTGKNYTGTVTAIQGDKYKVKYDGFDFEAWLSTNQFTVNDTPPTRTTTPTPKNTNGNAPTQKDLEAWMDKYITKEAQPGLDGAITYQIMSFRVGSSRKWQFNDGGNPANGHNTIVYPIKLHYLKKTHYWTRTAVYDSDCGYTAFKNGFGEWNFGQNSDPEIEKSYDEPADIKR